MDRMSFAPIVLFVYNRSFHTQKCIQALQENTLAKESELITFSDGPKSSKDKAAVDSVRKYLKTITGFKKVSVVERRENLGLAKSIISGVGETVNEHGRVIVLEDDLVSSPYFLKFMNEALEFYRDKEEVISIHGYVYPVGATLPETFFLKGADCWGWGTWKRGWDLFEPDGKKLLSELRDRGLEKGFDFNGSYPYTKMLEDQISGKNDSWAIRWYASAFIQDKLTLYPGRPLIKNIGTDASGTHLGKTEIYDVDVSREPVTIKGIPIEENEFAKKEIERYLRSTHPGLAGKLLNRVVRFFH
jgi:hypothetical protein